MKTVFTTQEGVKMNSKLNFGSTKKIENEFQFLMTTYESIFDEEFDYFYRITIDKYIQLAYSYKKSELKIIAQFKLQHNSKKDNIIFIIKKYIEANHLYNGYPTLKESPLFSTEEFNEIIHEIEHPKNITIEKTSKKITPLISYMIQQKLNPKPTGFNENSWIAKCPSGGNHFLQVVTNTEKWGCGYCKRKGGLQELKNWIIEKKNMDAQNRLSTMMKELKKGSIQTKKTMKWWMNRY